MSKTLSETMQRMWRLNEMLSMRHWLIETIEARFCGVLCGIAVGNEGSSSAAFCAAGGSPKANDNQCLAMLRHH